MELAGKVWPCVPGGQDIRADPIKERAGLYHHRELTLHPNLL
jgi:hypothetical protein